MKLMLIQVPYHLGKRGFGMGAGPLRFLQANIIQTLQDSGHSLKFESIELDRPFEDEIKAIGRLNTLLKEKVQEGVKQGYFPLILGGDCNTCLGTLAGLNDSSIGIVWFDAHGDFNTPETTPSGFFDGMPFAIATGQCYEDLWSQIADIPPIKEFRSLHIGGRELDPEEQILLEKSQIQIITTMDIKKKGIKESFLPVLTQFQSKTTKIYLHIDIDIVDPREAPGVNFPAPNGLSLNEVESLIRFIAKRFTIEAAALTAYNPLNDESNKTLNTGISILETIVKVKDLSTY